MKLPLLLFLATFISISSRAQGIYQLWGMTSRGGTNDIGTIFSTDSKGKNVVNRFSFDIAVPGRNPDRTELTEYNGQLFGVASSGGKNQLGVIFKWDPTSNVYTSLFDFSYLNGATPHGKLAFYNGKFYGMTGDGGINGLGVIFEFDPSSNTYLKKQDLTYISGCLPSGSLTVQGDRLYGMTNQGGDSGNGVIFEYDPVQNNFSQTFKLSSALGAHPLGSMTSFNGKLYGMTFDGGANGVGVIFEYDPSTNTYVQKQDLSQESGCSPWGNLVLKDNKFYGMTTRGGKAENGSGAIFEWDPLTNVYVKKQTLSEPSGEYPIASLTLAGDKFYGSGTGGPNHYAVIFEWDPAGNVYQVKQSLSESNGSPVVNTLFSFNGTLYGMTSNGGMNDAGTIFDWNPTSNVLEKKVDFSETNGSVPYGSLTVKDGKLYGMTTAGGKYGSGVIFEWDLATNKYSRKQDFEPSKGITPYGDLTPYGSKFYGMTNQGGDNNLGVIFEWDPASNVYIKKQSFESGNGANPYGSLVVKDDKLYGMTSLGGSNGYGVIFEWNPQTGSYIKKQDLSAANGGKPFGNMTLRDGNFYGLNSTGGKNQEGVLFKWDPTKNSYTKLYEFVNYANVNPSGNLVWKDDAFYGMTKRGIFKYGFTSNVFAEKKNLESYNTGTTPLGSLVLSGDKFYGMTSDGGGYGYGVVFEWDAPANLYKKTADLDFNSGIQPQTGALTLVPAPVSLGVPNTCTSATAVTIDASNNDSWVPITDSKGDAIAEINANGNDLGSIQASLFVNSGGVRADNQQRLYLDRNITITPQNKVLNPGTTVDVRFYITKSEYEAIAAASQQSIGTPIGSIADIGILKSDENTCQTSTSTGAVLITSTTEPWGHDYVFTTSLTSFSTFYFGTKNGTSLPVTLQSLQAKVVEQQGLVTWKTTDEVNFSHFEVERSEDGKSFATIGHVDSNERTDVGSYRYIDQLLSSVSSTAVYYRLKMVDIDGSYAYSVKVALNLKNMPEAIVVYPNPSGERLFIRTKSISNISWKIFNSNGKSMLGGSSLNPDSGIDIGSLSPGIYILKYMADGKQNALKFVKN